MEFREFESRDTEGRPCGPVTLCAASVAYVWKATNATAAVQLSNGSTLRLTAPYADVRDWLLEITERADRAHDGDGT